MRLELFFNSTETLKRLLRTYESFGSTLRGVNLPNKTKIKGDVHRRAIQLIRDTLPIDVHVVPHYSIQYEYNRNVENTLKRLKEFCLSASRQRIREILLVSGSQKRKVDSVQALQTLSKWNDLPKDIRFGVAFNPYVGLAKETKEGGSAEEGERALREERRRLEEKLNTGLVSSIWLQFGTNANHLRKELTRLRRITSVPIFGSVFVPTNRFLAQFRFRPWRGVYCNESYLSSVESATTYTHDLLHVYASFDVEPLVESAVSSMKEFETVQKLLRRHQTESTKQKKTRKRRRNESLSS